MSAHADRICEEVLPCRFCGLDEGLLTLWDMLARPQESSCLGCGAVLWLPMRR